MNRIAWAVLVPLAAATLVGLVLLWPSATPPPAQPPAPEFKGVVLALQAEECTGEQVGPPSSCGTVTARISTPEGDREIEAPLSRSPSAPDLSVGDEVVVAASESPDGPIYGVVDHQRGFELVLVLVALSLALVAFGRWRGFTALVGFVITFGVLFVFIVPSVIAGSSPVLVALVGASLITLSVLYLTHGASLPTTVAVLGTMTALALTAGLSELTVQLLRLTGTTDDVSTAVATTYGIDTRGLLVASIIIGSVGVLDDVTVTQAATVTEISRANPSYGVGQLFGAAARVGRSHIASVVNTVVLAYAGSSLPLLVLVVANNDSVVKVATTQLIAQEVARSAVATLGLIAAVPLTTALAALGARTAESGVRHARPTGQIA